MNLKPIVKERLKQTCQLYAFLLIPMWLMFVLNESILFDRWNRLGISPRSFEISNLVGIFGSWMMHADLAHIMGNTMLMVQILFLFGIFEKNPFRIVFLLVVGSGICTWLLGAPNSNHIGASGLAFAMLGFMLGGALFAKRWGYLIASVVLGVGFWLAMVKGLVPQQGISFAAHFGGLVAGLFLGANSHKHNKRLSHF